MADELERPGETPEHEDAEAHLPAPTIWPFAFAGAVALILVGLIVSYWATAIGIALAVVFGFLWIRQVTREVRGEPEPVEEPVAAVRRARRGGGRGGPRALRALEVPRGRHDRDRRRHRRHRHAAGARLRGRAGLRRPGLPRRRPGPARQLPRGRVADHDLHLQPRGRQGLEAHRVRPLQRPQGRRPELLHHLEPLRAPRLPDAAAGPARRAARRSRRRWARSS